MPWYDVPHYWPSIVTYVEAALAHGGITHAAADLRQQVFTRKSQLWVAVDDNDKPHACTITRVNVQPRARICWVSIIGGKDMDNWIHFSEDVARWAKERGCDAIEGPGRKGWTRVMKRYGYEPVFVIYRKMLR